MRDKKTVFFTLGGSTSVLWMFLNTFVTSNTGINLMFLAFAASCVNFFHLPPIDACCFSERIRSLLTTDSKKGNRKKHTIFHKGGAGHAPENTMEAIRHAIKLGIPAVEVDVSFTKDGVGVLCHGPKIDDYTDGSGFIHEKTWEEIQTLNAAAKFTQNRNPVPTEINGSAKSVCLTERKRRRRPNVPTSFNIDSYPIARIPTVEECVKECVENETIIFFDCKANPKKTVCLLTDLYKKYPALYDLGIVCSFYPQIIYKIRNTDSKMITALTHRNYILESLGDGSPRNKEFWKRLITPVLDRLLIWSHNYLFWYICGNSLFLLEKGAISGDTKRSWEKLGIHVVAWTVNDQEEKNYLIDNLGIPVITDSLVD